MEEIRSLLSETGIWSLAGVALAIFGGAFMRSFTGFGFAIAALPVLALVLPPRSAAFVVALLMVITSLRTWRFYMTRETMRDTWPLLPALVLGTIPGVILLGVMNPAWFQLAAGIMVIGASILLTAFKPGRIGRPVLARHSAGFFAGLMNGALAVPGPPVIVYAIAAFDQPDKSRAFLMLFFVFSGTFSVISYIIAGYVEVSHLLIASLALPFLYAGDKLGFAAFEKFGSAFYRKVAISALMVVGAITTTKAIISL